MRLLRGSQMPGLKSSDVYKVVKIIEQENLPNSLSNMSKNVFLKKVEWIFEHNILKRDPFCSFCLNNFQNGQITQLNRYNITGSIKTSDLTLQRTTKTYG